MPGRVVGLAVWQIEQVALPGLLQNVQAAQLHCCTDGVENCAVELETGFVDGAGIVEGAGEGVGE